MSLNFFNPKRTQPFIITLFMAIMAFKRVCKMMRKRLAVLHKKTHSHQLSAFRYQLKKSHMAVVQAMRGKDVILPSYVQTMMEEEHSPHAKTHEVPVSDVKTPRKISTQKKVSRYLDDYQVKLRLGRGAPATVDRLQKSLVINDTKAAQQAVLTSKPNLTKRRSTMMITAIKAAEVSKGPEDFSKAHDNLHGHHAHHGHHHTHQHHAHTNTNTNNNAAAEQQKTEEKGKDDASALALDDELGYEAGTAIYFGATVALQARHGGFLSYNSSEIKASAHKVLNNSRFIVKNSEDLTDMGVMKYGAALWLQAGHHDVLGAQYGTLVDQKRTIQPALVSCKRASMFKAQQYGRWVILNRSKPMETLGQPVLHDDKVILEQEWFFLASSSPYQSSMYKTLNNSDEAMTTKMDLFQPGDECSWKIHLVALPSEDKAGELQRQLLLQQAKESIDDSAAMRYEKAPSLLTSLQSKLPAELTDESLFSNQLSRKMHQKENQEYLLNTYRQLGTKQFHSNYNPLKFLGKIYGPDSNIVRYKAFVLERNESEVPCGLYEQSQQAQHGSKDSHPDDVHKTSTERAHDDYWNSAQRVLVDTKSWVQLPSAMTKYYKGDRTKKIRAAMVLQKWIRKFLNSTFDFERAMKRIDQVARNKLQEKLIARRKFLLEHVSTMEMVDTSHDRSASMKSNFSTTTAGPGLGLNKHRGRSMPGGGTGSTGGSPPVNQLVRVPTANRSASLNVEVHTPTSPGGGNGSLSPSTEERRRSKSMYNLTRSQSISQINDISQIVGIAGMAAIFSAAGIPLTPDLQPLQDDGPAPILGGPRRSQSVIFAHTEVENENDSVAPEDQQGARAMLMNSHLSRSMSSLPNVNRGMSPSRSGKGRGSFAATEAESRLDAINSFTAHLGFATTMPELAVPGSSKMKPNTEVRPVSAGPTGPYDSASGVGIAYQEAPRASQKFDSQVSPGQGPVQRPHTANAALQSSSRMQAEEEERLAQLAHEEAKAAKKEQLRQQTQKDKRRLCRSAEKDYGLPRDIFRGTHDDVSAKIGLKFLKAMSSNPSIYDDIDVKKRASSASRHRHHSASRRPPGSNMW